MAGNKIVEVLDCCRIENCNDCPYRQYYNCREAAMQDAIDLINNQKTEIDTLYKENLDLKDGYFQKHYEETEHLELMGLREAYRRVDKERDYFQLEAMNLKEENNELTKKYTFLVKENNAISKALFEIDRELRTYSDNAIKEFAKRLKENAASYEVTTAYAEDEEVEAVEVKVIENLIKEMVIDWNELDSFKEVGDFMSEHPEEITSLNIRIERQEAIKEFTERLKDLKIKPEFPWDDFYVTETAIDNLVKEMTERTNEGYL